MARCGLCDSEVADNSRFCPTCGKAVVVDAFATQTVAVSGSSGTRNSSPWTAKDSRFLPGALLADRYRIVALLGKGGMGEVYRAEDLTLGQQVALKFLPEAVARNEQALTRFRNEVRIARQVSHPNVCRVYDVGEIDGHIFLSMEYVDGEDLGSLLRRIGRLPPDKALEISRKLCAGLAAAHEKGVLHRDLKPANVMLDGRGQVLLTDFGLAGLAEEIEGAEIRNGTPAYMAPEQLAGKEVTVRSDIYSLGLVFYEIFTGKRPFEASTLDELVRAQSQTTPVSLTTLVRDLDPAVERVVIRCLDPEPSRRPSSALAVAAALPGGDPLAAALAAGETPSPRMVAAAGEGTGLAPRVAIPLFLAVIAGLIGQSVVANRTSALERIQPAYSSEVLSEKARDLIHKLGYGEHSNDDAYGFDWANSFIDYVQKNDKPSPRWREVLAQPPSPLRFWYRESNYPLTALMFHNDRLTPGMVDATDPPPVLSGMIDLELDSQGRLIRFEAIPPERQEPPKQNPQVDWSALFAAAGVDPAKLQPAEPRWTFLAASDTRTAWTGTWPGTNRPLRVEAAALRGKPVAFSLLGPWSKPDRMPPLDEPGQFSNVILIGLVAMLFIGGPLLARRSLLQGKADRQGAFRLACFIFYVQMALWICQGHFSASIGPFAMAFLAVCTSVFYGALIWTVYIALEPFVRRHWPQTIISWTTVLTGRVRDPIVGRDVLFGIGVGVSWKLIERIGEVFLPGSGAAPRLDSTGLLLGVRSTVAAWLLHVPGSVRGVLIFFFMLFLLRVWLKRQWLAGAVFVLFWVSFSVSASDHPVTDGVLAVLIYSIIAVAVVRLGLLALTIGIFLDGLLQALPVTVHASAWYFGNTVFLLATVVAMAIWAFYTSIAGRRLWKQDLFG